VEAGGEQVLVPGEDEHVHDLGEVLQDLLGRGERHAPDLLEIGGGQPLVEVARYFGE